MFKTRKIIETMRRIRTEIGTLKRVGKNHSKKGVWTREWTGPELAEEQKQILYFLFLESERQYFAVHNINIFFLKYFLDLSSFILTIVRQLLMKTSYVVNNITVNIVKILVAAPMFTRNHSSISIKRYIQRFF